MNGLSWFLGLAPIPRPHHQQANLLDIGIVYIDLETTGLQSDSHILQLSALFETKTFNVYVECDEQDIDPRATAVHGLRHHNNRLYLRNKRLRTVSICDAMMKFRDFLMSLPALRVVLVGHNVSFDAIRLVRAMIYTGLIDQFGMIRGFIDSLKLFKTVMPDRKGHGKFKLETLASDFLEQSAGVHHHNALSDVKTLKELIVKFDLEDKLKDVIPLLYYRQKIFEEVFNF